MLPDIPPPSPGLPQSSDVGPTTILADKNIDDDSTQDKFASGPIVGWRNSTGSDEHSASPSGEHKGKPAKVKRSTQHAEVSSNKKHMKKCAMS